MHLKATPPDPRKVLMAILVAALGYFVDVFDLLLFGIVRVQSLKDLGLSGDELLHKGVFLLNAQMLGMLLGGLVWGILGDKLGRIQVLFGSISLYSLATLLNAFVADVQMYAIFRFVSGIGLAGELGAGITLVSELTSRERRGLATTFVATVGVLGAVAACVISQLLDWRSAYIVGGLMGFALLFLRIGVSESGIFRELAERENVRRGDLRLLLKPARTLLYLACILIGVPVWFSVGIIITFSPEIGVALHLDGPVVASRAILINYIGISSGGLVSGLISQWLKSRKLALLLFLLGALASSMYMLTLENSSADVFYLWCGILGFFGGYWAVFVTTAAEQFGTNIRATVTTTVPNFVRGAVVPMTTLFAYLQPRYGIINAAIYDGLLVYFLGLAAMLFIKESYGRKLDFVED